MLIRKAKVSEVSIIRDFLEDNSQHGVIPRTLSYLYSHIHDYWVAECTCAPILKPQIVGIAALHVCWGETGEIRSLVVKEGFRGRDIGAKLMRYCLAWAIELGLKKVFLLCLIPEYFKKFGFKEVPRSDLPPVAWADCVSCLKFPNCDEIPMLMDL
jgi:amino-acid N-acetyltransferase